jgi:hypothetical protein
MKKKSLRLIKNYTWTDWTLNTYLYMDILWSCQKIKCVTTFDLAQTGKNYIRSFTPTTILNLIIPRWTAELIQQIMKLNSLNTVVEWLPLLFCIQEVPGSDFNPETSYTDRVLVVFLSLSRQMLR